jgi:hypothetical protein
MRCKRLVVVDLKKWHSDCGVFLQPVGLLPSAFFER